MNVLIWISGAFVFTTFTVCLIANCCLKERRWTYINNEAEIEV